jgi:release factor glutamine methyltransferase
MKMFETVAARLLAARQALVVADIDGSALDARLLMQAATGLSHEDLVANPDAELSGEASQKFTAFLKRRLAHEPISRILSAREFYGRDFLVTPAVLDPRADTEALIELVLALPRPPQGRLIDIGTGSGAIAVTLLAEMANFTGIAVDLSADALHVAKTNALANGVSGQLQFHQGSWFAGIGEKFDLIVSNPPYIPHDVIAGLGAEVKNYDPHLALDGGADGLFAYRALAAGAKMHLVENGVVAVEIGAGQGPDVTAIFSSNGFEPLGQRVDLGGHLRALTFR